MRTTSSDWNNDQQNGEEDSSHAAPQPLALLQLSPFQTAMETLKISISAVLTPYLVVQHTQPAAEGAEYLQTRPRS